MILVRERGNRVFKKKKKICLSATHIKQDMGENAKRVLE
jgi:hypothetical protein